MQRLGKNVGGYRGETLDIRAVLREVEVAAREHGWGAEVFHQTTEFKWLALHRAAGAPGPGSKIIYLSAGIHGDEPAGPLTVLRLLRENQWPANMEIWLCPCLNPAGFVLNTRENAEKIDLNRDYLAAETAETRAHIAWLERRPKFDLYLCLHEDWESQGFYLYEQNPDNGVSYANKIMDAVRTVCPIDGSAIIEGRAAEGGIIRPNVAPLERPDWPEAFYLITHKSRLGYTLEAPSDFSLEARVSAEVAGVRAVLDAISLAEPGQAT